MIVTGQAGTGKSVLISQIAAYESNSVILLAPTGVAATNINGSTIHSALGLPLNTKQISMKGEKLRNLQARWKNIKTVVVDEMSMISSLMLNLIDQFMRQVFPDKNDVIFGDRSVLLFGDFLQLPPVANKPMFTIDGPGFVAYRSFDHVVELTQIMRQSQNEIQFVELLQRARLGILNVADWNLLNTRCQGIVDPVSILHLFATNESVSNHNLTILPSLQQPFINIKATHGGSGLTTDASDLAGNLQGELLLCCDSKVMLTTNLSTKHGLVNGAIGTVQRIVFNPGTAPPSLPQFVVVSFPSYKGPQFYLPNCVPIQPITRSYEKDGGTCTRKQLPLTLAFGVTIHKSQGMSLRQAVIDIGEKDFSAGLTYVALSRLRTLDGLFLPNQLNFSRLSNLGNSDGAKASKKEQERLTECSRATEEKYRKSS